MVYKVDRGKTALRKEVEELNWGKVRTSENGAREDKKGQKQFKLVPATVGYNTTRAFMSTSTPFSYSRAARDAFRF
jgi:hypothetical protein